MLKMEKTNGPSAILIKTKNEQLKVRQKKCLIDPFFITQLQLM